MGALNTLHRGRKDLWFLTKIVVYLGNGTSRPMVTMNH